MEFEKMRHGTTGAAGYTCTCILLLCAKAKATIRFVAIVPRAEFLGRVNFTFQQNLDVQRDRKLYHWSCKRIILFPFVAPIIPGSCLLLPKKSKTYKVHVRSSLNGQYTYQY